MWADAQRDGRPAFAQRRKVWLTPAAGVPRSDAANIGERKTWAQSEFSNWQNSAKGQEPPECINSVPAQETAKHRAKFGWPPLSDIAAVMKPRHEPFEICWGAPDNRTDLSH